MNNKKYTQLLYGLLEKLKVKSGEPHTHFSMGKPYGCFNITKIDDQNLFSLYYEKALREKSELYLLEKHKSNYGPIIIDIDINYQSNNEERKYNYEHIQNIIFYYNKVINKYLDVKKDDFYAFVTEKKSPSICSGNNYKDGFHILYPNIWVNNKIQFIIRDEVVKMAIKDNIFNDINPSNKYEDIFDIAVIQKNGWFLYGSGKPKKEKYELTHIIDKDFKKCNKSEFLGNKDLLIESLSIRSKGKNDLINIKSNISQTIIDEKYSKLKVGSKQKKRKKKEKLVKNILRKI